MASGKALLGSVLGRFLFRSARITEVEELAPRFRRLTCMGAGLVGVPWTPGDKVQVFLPSVGMRTYTPLSWDASTGTTRLLVYVHGDSPGARWGREAKVGDVCQFLGPRSSIDGASLTARAVLFGDETSFAVAHALRHTRRAQALRCVFEVSDPVASANVLQRLGVEHADCVPREAGDGHLELLSAQLRDALLALPEADLVLTGRAQAIQAMRARLREEGLARPGRNKAYWSEGKAGLD
ncbi:siderophore-interacting protein [Myxococcaceae bacterium JPH2]|nr:siderophore-interacting protein [Myxococcaceae bacterium JPH2]